MSSANLTNLTSRSSLFSSLVLRKQIPPFWDYFPPPIICQCLLCTHYFSLCTGIFYLFVYIFCFSDFHLAFLFIFTFFLFLSHFLPAALIAASHDLSLYNTALPLYYSSQSNRATGLYSESRKDFGAQKSSCYTVFKKYGAIRLTAELYSSRSKLLTIFYSGKSNQTLFITAESRLIKW